jgi:hypothetical protein
MEVSPITSGQKGSYATHYLFQGQLHKGSKKIGVPRLGGDRAHRLDDGLGELTPLNL